jgi:hypothetical protein
MNSSKVKTGHWELAVCLIVPPVVIIAILLCGFVYERKQEQLLTQRGNLLGLIPGLEQTKRRAQQVLKPFIVPGVVKDRAADLSLCVSDAAQKFGFVIGSSSVEKHSDPGAGVWMDYKVTLSGEGPLTSLIAFLDYLGQPQRRFRAAQVSLRTLRLIPETTCSADLVLISRVVTDRNGNSGVAQVIDISPAMAADIGVKLDKTVAGVKGWLAEPVTALPLKNLQNRTPFIPPDPSQVEVDSQVSFRLTGVVREKNNPMIMTDKGVFGVGDEVDGFKVEAISEDKVTVVSKGGRRETVRLYKGGGGM